jgi:hypothetical protein
MQVCGARRYSDVSSSRMRQSKMRAKMTDAKSPGCGCRCGSLLKRTNLEGRVLIDCV